MCERGRGREGKKGGQMRKRKENYIFMETDEIILLLSPPSDST